MCIHINNTHTHTHTYPPTHTLHVTRCIYVSYTYAMSFDLIPIHSSPLRSLPSPSQQPHCSRISLSRKFLVSGAVGCGHSGSEIQGPAQTLPDILDEHCLRSHPVHRAVLGPRRGSRVHAQPTEIPAPNTSVWLTLICFRWRQLCPRPEVVP